MSYYTRFKGSVKAQDDIRWAAVKDTKYLTPHDGPGGEYHLFRADLETERVETDDGLLERKYVRTFWPDSEPVNHAPDTFCLGEIEDIVAAFPDVEFEGEVYGQGETREDLWRVRVVGREVVLEKAKITWGAS